ncbi:hypothetical protein SAMN05216338_105065 [Bradyrhizobium sp. Rc2d]|uniref:Rap1a/Tai family immunity protein n=1 Tax=Bradyrhizobium sp. Rc2d TaxID=1855321 RepID=UPI000886BC87|nr:Rap1a/Tai family immunity protein [Bradyrhizobium sp. Rc2d]SDJ47181.1 hypothetical protein SAMN05216338_105065 [Bradyrhizobium sp. Rc2d]
MKIAVPLALLALLLATPSRAQSGKDLFNLCTSDKPVERGSCELYISGFVHGFVAGNDLHNTVCLPDDVSGHKAADIFKRFLSDVDDAARAGKVPATNENRFFTARQEEALTAVLAMTYPCPAKR